MNILLNCPNCKKHGTVSVLASTNGNTISVRKYSRTDTHIALTNTSAGTISCGNCQTDAYIINNGTVQVT